MTEQNPSLDAPPGPLPEGVRLSAARLWDWQQEYFASAGVAAWAGQVPFYITSNPFIAYAYAQVMARYIQDLCAAGQEDAVQEVYIVELGAGSGMFSYYCLRYLVQLHDELRLPCKPCYVMTDFTQSNIDFWKSHPLFQPFVARGFLDMALFDVDDPQPLALQQRQQTLLPGTAGRAVICLANYVLDSTRHDLFQVKDHGLQEGLVLLQTPPELPEDTVKGKDTNPGQDKEAKPRHLDGLSYKLRLRPIEAATYYPNPRWNQVLVDYCKDPDLAGHFLFPAAVLGALEFLRELGGGRLMLLSSDKGYTSPGDIANRSPPKLVFHGSFSFSVNFDALRRYAEKQQGLWFHQPQGAGLRTCAYILGTLKATLPRTVEAIATHIQRFGPCDYYRLYAQMKKLLPADVTRLVEHLRLARWDPRVVMLHGPKLRAGLTAADKPLQEEIRQGLQEAEALLYPMPGMQDPFLELAMLHAALGNLESSIRLLQRSSQHFPDRPASYFQLGLVYWGAGMLQAARIAFADAMEREADGSEARMWLQRLRPRGRGLVPRHRRRLLSGTSDKQPDK